MGRSYVFESIDPPIRKHNMATRRGAEQEKTHLDQDEIKEGKPSNISPAVPGSVIAKLLGFTFAMVTLPLGSYFASVNTIFGGNSTYAGALAALMAKRRSHWLCDSCIPGRSKRARS